MTGVKLVLLDEGTTGTEDSGEPQKHALEHCPYCSTHTTALGMPPSPLSPLKSASQASRIPELFLLAPRTLFAWVSAQPRAPPTTA